MERNRPVGTPFREGDYVVLAEGTYPGTLGVFLRLKEDVNWADIAERSGVVRSHPVAWLDHAAATIPPATIPPAHDVRTHNTPTTPAPE